MSRPLVVIHSAVLLLFGSDVFLVGANRPPAPVNVSVVHLSSDSATVSWEVPEGDVIIGFSVSQQRQDRHTQRFIREVNTSSRACVLWDLQEDTDYVIQVQSIGLYGESQASKKVHFRTLKKTERFPSNSSNQVSPIRAVHQHHRSVTPIKREHKCNTQPRGAQRHQCTFAFFDISNAIMNSCTL
ncbi:fibronectin type III domain-containing protein 4 isoform X2 [Syngnathus scovelli]|uniref:fibronectin type III domain-containing protein 4 isoform X2 n=1 Tax=Syngnathus scovelli TaxID=161590 RepID=UPI00211044C7|nr:fibronectin type III domain-containing protein 4 isoform X2 [Syngnathus scovelli]